MVKRILMIVLLLVVLLVAVGCAPDSAVNVDFSKLEQEKAKLVEEKAALQKELDALKSKPGTVTDSSEVAKLKAELAAVKKKIPQKEVEQDSPFDHVKDSQIRVLKQKVEINVADVFWWTIEDTNSMDPLLDIGATALSVKPKSEAGIRRGDVAFYQSLIVDSVIVHRVIEINKDGKGWYSRFQGDNLKEPDPELVRYPQIEGVLIGIIY